MKQVDLSNNDVALYAIYRLSGIEKKVHTEHIAMECFELAKERFCWRLPEYRQHPDKEITRLTLKNLGNVKHAKYGRLVIGRSGVEASGKEADGWMLTPDGAKWIIKNCRRIEKALRIETTAVKRPDIQRIMRKFGQEKCYQKFLQYGNLEDVSEYDFRDMLSCSPDAYPENVRKEFDRLKTKGEMTKNKSILLFLKACEETFGRIMSSKHDEAKGEDPT